MIYPRFLIRTSHALGIVMMSQFVLMMLLIAAAIAARPLQSLALPFACALMSIALGKRALTQLQQLETSRNEPDALMLMLFDFAFGVPTIGILAVAGMLAP